MTNAPTGDFVPPSRSTRKYHSLVFQTPSAGTDIYKSSFFLKTIIENGTPWQIPLFLLLSVQRNSFTGTQQKLCEIVPVLLKVTGRFDPFPVRTPGCFSPILFLSGCIGLGRFSPISGVGCFCQLWWVVSAHYILYSYNR